MTEEKMQRGNNSWDAELEIVQECRICRASRFHFVFAANDWKLMRCDECGIVFTSPRYTSETLARIYGSAYYEQATDYFESRSLPPSDDHVRIARQVARHVRKPSPTAIDIGTGCGQMVSAFSTIGFRASGTEPSSSACEIARRHGRDVTNVAIENLPSEAYDCVVALHVLEHVPEPLQFVRHMARITAPGGVVAIEVPNFASASSRKLGAAWTALYPDTHLFQFTPATLSHVCKLAGLAVVAIHRVGGAGVCGCLADVHPTPITQSLNKPTLGQTDRPLRGRLKQAIWEMRKPLLKVPGMRRFLRWINWELLGYGEYVRVIARKA